MLLQLWPVLPHFEQVLRETRDCRWSVDVVMESCWDGRLLVVRFEMGSGTDDEISVGNGAGILDGNGVDERDAMIDDGGVDCNFRD